MQQIESKINEIKKRFNESKFNEDKKAIPLIDDVSLNLLRRQLYSEIELVRLDYEDLLASKRNSSDIKSTSNLIEDLDKLGSKLRLVPIKRKAHWWKWIDIIFRFIGVCVTIFSAGVYISIALILIRGVEEFLQIDPYIQLSVRMRKLVVWYILSVTGISVEIRPSAKELKSYFQSQCALLTFSHASNLDGFLVSLTCPIRHVALAKKELFIVPFFAWISLAIGGMPVDRENRERAVEALQRSTEAVVNGKVSIVIAPEGTRSTTGQLLPFKKGPFHLWEQLKCPIIPFVIHGAWDLYPVGSLVNNTGKVVVEYLKPIIPESGANRDSVLRIVRRKMLEATRDCPRTICDKLTWREQILSIMLNLIILAFNLFIFYYAKYTFFTVLKLSLFTVLIGSVVTTFAITIWLYIYNVYIISSKKGKKLD